MSAHFSIHGPAEYKRRFDEERAPSDAVGPGEGRTTGKRVRICTGKELRRERMLL
jgi:hypothetical protein